MLLVRDEDYRGWHIRTYCRENKPQEWKPGDPVTCVARACIESRTPQKLERGSAQFEIYSIPDEGNLAFPAWPEAHSVLLAASKKLIDRKIGTAHSDWPRSLAI